MRTNGHTLPRFKVERVAVERIVQTAHLHAEILPVSLGEERRKKMLNLGRSEDEEMAAYR